MNITSIPAKIPVAWGANATATYIRTIPSTTADPTAASWSLGWPPETGTPILAGGTPPLIQDENGALNAISAWTVWQEAGAPVFYDGNFSTSINGYPKGSILTAANISGLEWYSSIGNNTANPDTGGGNWTGVTPFSLFGTDNGTANAANVTLPVAFGNLSQMRGWDIRVQKISAANSGNMTVNVNGIGATALTHADGTQLNTAELPANGIFSMSCNGSAFQLQSLGISPVTGNFLQIVNNLSDLSSAPTARTNLGLGAAALQALSAFLQPANNLSDLDNVPAALGNLTFEAGVGWFAVPNVNGNAFYIQFGSIPLTSGSNITNTTLTFPRAFPNSVLMVTGSANGSANGSWNPIVLIFESASTTGCTIVADTANAAQRITNPVSALWVAIGD